ncbi:MAG: hypothetical protein CM15mP21_0670 [Hyphomicrobiales bacterium]|nr:MAG: hypothetical protein CM15mP21_0670 [Hyphomicrobiales bacterium]
MLVPVFQFAGLSISNPPQPSALGFGHIDGVFVGAEADAVGRFNGKNHLLNMAAIGLGVIDGASVFEAVVGFAQIGEPEAARAVEHNVIRGNEGMVVACIVEPLNRARCQVNALNAPPE